MSPALKQTEIDALLALMTCRGEISNTELDERYGLRIDGPLRRSLVDEGYITAERKGNSPFRIELTETGWKRCREEFASEGDSTARRSARIHRGVMRVWDAYLTRNRLQLADLLADESPAAPLSAEQVLKAYSELAPRADSWVRLRELRERLHPHSKEEVDPILTELFRERAIQLIPEENQKALTDADHKAAIWIGHEDRHLIALGVRLWTRSSVPSSRHWQTPATPTPQRPSGTTP